MVGESLVSRGKSFQSVVVKDLKFKNKDLRFEDKDLWSEDL